MSIASKIRDADIVAVNTSVSIRYWRKMSLIYQRLLQ